MKIFYWILLFLAFNLPVRSQKRMNPEVIAYYTGNGENLDQYRIDGLTHIIYSFLHLRGDTLAFTNPGQEAILKKLVSLKQQHPRLKVMVALGGWGGCETCSPVFASDSGRAHFIASAVRLMKSFNLDGLDLDWEYPVVEGYPGHPYGPDDITHFTLLIQGLRKAFGRKYEISFAAGGFTSFIEAAIDWKAVMKKADRVNLMSYDLVNGYGTQTGHHTPLYSNEQQLESADHGVQLLIQRGVPPGKIVIGAAFYARTWKAVKAAEHGLYQPGIFQSFVPYRDVVKQYTDSTGYITYYDKRSNASWKYHEREQVFATFDTPESVAAKAAYVRRHGLRGIMFWELTLDRPRQGLLEAILEALEH